AKAKAPALAGKSGWKTPLRATNRVLTGPFKTDAEARAFVNTLTKAGIGAFTFTSDAGQVVEKLSSK
ncbi:SPOR domain-containing protein, partial [Escherichia coli]|nr:SPOR domain-containing protein [Escherichia coli]